MSDQDDEPHSPTVTMVLDAFIKALKADGDFDHEAVTRLDDLLRLGKVAKPTDVDAALFGSKEGVSKS